MTGLEIFLTVMLGLVIAFLIVVLHIFGGMFKRD